MTKKRTVGPDIGFTLEEAVVMHATLMGSKARLEANSHAIIKQNGQDVFDSIKSRHITALEKIEELVRIFKDRQEASDATQQ